MKRHLDCSDYIRITHASVDGRFNKYGEDAKHNEFYHVLCVNGWDAVRRNGYTASTKEMVFRKHMLHEVYGLESDVVSTKRPLTHMISDQPKTYRVSLTEKGGVEVVCFDLENVDSELEGYYDEVSDLPTWVQERIAVLSVCNPDPPTPVVEGIGRRISEGIFWIYK